MRPARYWTSPAGGDCRRLAAGTCAAPTMRSGQDLHQKPGFGMYHDKVHETQRQYTVTTIYKASPHHCGHRLLLSFISCQTLTFSELITSLKKDTIALGFEICNLR